MGGGISSTPPPHLPPGKTRYPFYKRLRGPQGRFGRAENLVPTGIWSRTVQPLVSRYTDWATGPITSGCRAQIRIWIPSLLHTYPSHLTLFHLIPITISVEQYKLCPPVTYQLSCTAQCFFTYTISSWFYAFRCLFTPSSWSFNLTTVPSQHIKCLCAFVGCLSKIVVCSQDATSCIINVFSAQTHNY